MQCKWWLRIYLFGSVLVPDSVNVLINSRLDGYAASGSLSHNFSTHSGDCVAAWRVACCSPAYLERWCCCPVERLSRGERFPGPAGRAGGWCGPGVQRWGTGTLYRRPSARHMRPATAGRCTDTGRWSSAAHGGENRTRKTPANRERASGISKRKMKRRTFLALDASDLLLECSHSHVRKDFDCYTRRRRHVLHHDRQAARQRQFGWAA